MKTAIIFGAGGQDGHYLRQILEREDVYCLAYDHINLPVENPVAVSQVIEHFKPDYIFHLAARSSVDPQCQHENITTILNGTANIIEAVHRINPATKIFLSGSILQFQGEVVSLSSQRAMDTDYARYRNAASDLARASRSMGLQVYVGYFSHHDSPRRADHHLTRKIVTRVAGYIRGEFPAVIVENPRDRKEWNYAGDIMEAVWILVNSDTYEAVIGSGLSYSLYDFINQCGLSQAVSYIPILPLEDREPKSIVTSPRQIKALGWQPRVSMPQLAAMMMDYELACHKDWSRLGRIDS